MHAVVRNISLALRVVHSEIVRGPGCLSPAEFYIEAAMNQDAKTARGGKFHHMYMNIEFPTSSIQIGEENTDIEPTRAAFIQANGLVGVGVAGRRG